jgi:hypothetical protein
VETDSAQASPAPRLRVRDVRTLRGFGWIGGAFRIFRMQPITWIALSMGCLLMMIGLLLIPLIGGVIANFLVPVFFASFALAARRTLDGERLEMGDLFSGFRGNVRALINLGALMLLLQFAIVALMVALGLPTLSEDGKAATLADFARALKGKEWILLLGSSLSALVQGAFWFAPALIAFHGMSTSHAARWSVYAALSNIGAMLMFGFALTLLFIVALLPSGLGLIVAIPLLFASGYASYAEVFEMPEDAATPQ